MHIVTVLEIFRRIELAKLSVKFGKLSGYYSTHLSLMGKRAAANYFLLNTLSVTFQ
jgi:hypothetical protein